MIARLMAEIEAEEEGVGQPVFSPDEMVRLLEALERRDGSDTGDWHGQVRHKLRAALGARAARRVSRAPTSQADGHVLRREAKRDPEAWARRGQGRPRPRQRRLASHGTHPPAR
jgi:hypothetical protein